MSTLSKRIGLNTLVILAIGINISPLQAADWYVSPDGADRDNGSEDTPFATIQHAVDTASPGDHILLSPGTYFEPGILVVGKSLTIEGLEGSAYTSIDAQGIERALLLENIGFFHLSGVSLINGKSTPLGLSGWEDWQGGGALFAYDVDDLLIEDCAFLDSSATGDTGYGGGMDVIESGSVQIMESQFQNNTASVLGGGLTGYNVEDLYLHRVEFTGNSCPTYKYAALSVEKGVSAHLDHLTVFGNIGKSGESEALGLWRFDQMEVSNSIIYDNFPSDGVYLSGNETQGLIHHSIVKQEESIAEFGSGIFYQNPLFLRPDSNDLADTHLSEGSPAIDQADPDSDGDGIPFERDEDDQDPDGSRKDLGAYIYNINDLDGDGIGNELDNCPDLSNPDQVDSDLDGVGDACSDTSSSGCATSPQEQSEMPTLLSLLALFSFGLRRHKHLKKPSSRP